MTLSRQDLTRRFVESTQRLYGRMRSGPPEDWSETELTVPQIRTLVLLQQGPRRMTEIASFLGSSPSAGTSLIDRLVNKRLVERGHDLADRRVVTCLLTPLGQEEVERFWRIGRSEIEAVTEMLGHQELETVVRAMEILLAAVTRRAEAGLLAPAPTDAPTPVETHQR